MKPERISLISAGAIAVGFVLLLVGVALLGDTPTADPHDREHTSHAPAILFWSGVALFVGGCLVRAWQFSPPEANAS